MEEITREQAYYIMGIEKDPIKYGKVRGDIAYMHDEGKITYIEILRQIYLSMKEEYIDKLETEGEKN